MKDPLKIAMLAPISWPVPPTGYGPWEQVAHNITEGLVQRGHDVTLFAAKGSKTSAKLVETVPYSMNTIPDEEKNKKTRFNPESGLLEGAPDSRVLEQLHIAKCMEASLEKNFDVVHSHLHVHALPFSRFISAPLVSTLHGAAWVKSAHPLFDEYKDNPFVSLSYAERTMKPDLNYIANVYNGINLEDFPFQPEKQDYLLFAGRLSPEKGPDKAIEVAQRSGRPLKLAGLIEPQHQDFFNTKVRPHINNKDIQYLGLLNQKDLAREYQNAAAVMFMIDWCEPCAMVGIETQASGTPIIGTRFGYLPELIRDNETGFLVNSIDEAVEATHNLPSLNPQDARRNVEERFSVETMAKGYEAAYETALGRK